jgi:cell shape-determining protein MreC
MFQKGKQKEQKITVLIVALFFNLFLMSSNIVLKNKQSLFHNIISSIASPFQIGFQKTIDFISFEIKHYIFLKNTFSKYHVLKKKITKLKYENYILRKKIEKLGFLESVEKKYDSFIVAEVISIDSSVPFNSVFINKGSKDGINYAILII